MADDTVFDCQSEWFYDSYGFCRRRSVLLGAGRDRPGSRPSTRPDECRFKTDCSRSGFAARRQLPPEPAIRGPARRPTAVPPAAATQQRWTRRGAERLLPAKVIGSSRPIPAHRRAPKLSDDRPGSFTFRIYEAAVRGLRRSAMSRPRIGGAERLFKTDCSRSGSSVR